ncbi:hypothetical protein BT69DRAFT_1285927, partial [Atractiella rhizophila]
IGPKFWNRNKTNVHEPPEVHLQSVGRRIEGGLQVSYTGVIVEVETETNVEKRT